MQQENTILQLKGGGTNYVEFSSSGDVCTAKLFSILTPNTSMEKEKQLDNSPEFLCTPS